MSTTKRRSISSFNDIKSYIASQPESIRPTLEKLRQTIRKAVPEAEEVISYQMPAFKYHGIVMYFAAFAKHYSIFVRPVFLNAFRNDLTGYTTTKSAVHIPLDRPVPVRLVTTLAKYTARQNREAREQTRKKKTGLKRK